MDDQLATIEQVRTTLIDLALRFGPRLIAAVVILAAGFFVGRAISRWIDRGLLHLEMEPPARLLLVRIARGLVMAVFVIMAMQNLGVELLPLVAGLGIAGAGIALAMQGLLGNVFAGLSIIFTKPFRVGEYISIAGEEGRVETITLFSTTLSHPDRSYVVIPNRKIAGEILHNYGKIRQVCVGVGVAYDADLNQVLATVNEIVGANARVLSEPKPVIGVALLADSTVNVTARPWVSVQDFGAAALELNKSIVERFRERGIGIPFPQREIRVLEPLRIEAPADSVRE
jgi:small conductance mechanosensitive channel